MTKKEESPTSFTIGVPIPSPDPLLALEKENEQSLIFAERLKQILKNNTRCFFISPHLDDAIYSAGSLISFLSDKTEVNLITLFTAVNRVPTSTAARRWLEISGHADEDQHYATRRDEDVKACVVVGAKPIHLGYVGTIWRRENIGSPMLGYNPLYTPEDIELMHQTHEKLRQFTDTGEPFVIFGPIGLGGHIDHMFTKEVLRQTFDNITFWVDFPYSQNSAITEEALGVSDLFQAVWGGSSDKKIRGVLTYESQNKANFQTGTITFPREHYYFSPTRDPCSLQK